MVAAGTQAQLPAMVGDGVVQVVVVRGRFVPLALAVSQACAWLEGAGVARIKAVAAVQRVVNRDTGSRQIFAQVAAAVINYGRFKWECDRTARLD